MESPTIEINIEGIEEAIEKTNQLIQLLREAKNLIDSLSHSEH